MQSYAEDCSVILRVYTHKQSNYITIVNYFQYLFQKKLDIFSFTLIYAHNDVKNAFFVLQIIKSLLQICLVIILKKCYTVIYSGINMHFCIFNIIKIQHYIHESDIVMKYFVLVFDGMADRKNDDLGKKTPMEVAKKPTLDALSKKSTVGTVLNVPEGLKPESDTANLAILSYDPLIYSKGRSPLEAVSLGIELAAEDTAIRMNVVTVSDDDSIPYEEKIMLDHSADEISSEEARELVLALGAAMGDDVKHFYPGVSYRHCLIWKNADEKFKFTPPHDIIGKKIGEYLPKGEAGKEFFELMKSSYDVLAHHPINEARRARGQKPANSAWLWSPGKNPSLPSFKEKWGLDATVISAVDLIKGIGICAGTKVPDIEGATGNVHTNYKGKADAAIKAFSDGDDFVFVHVEAPDECGHRGEVENKVLSIEYIDDRILRPVYEYLRSTGEDFKILCLPDHPTPLAIRTHSREPVPFMLYSSKEEHDGVESLTEQSAEDKEFYIPDGTRLLDMMIEK